MYLGRQILSTPKQDPMKVNRKHLEFMMTKIFTFPRNHQFDKVGITFQNIPNYQLCQMSDKLLM